MRRGCRGGCVAGAAPLSPGQGHQAEEVPDAEVLMSPGLQEGLGVRLVFSRDRLIGATILGDTRNALHYKKLIAERIPAWDFRKELLKQNFNPLRLHL